MWGTGWKDSKLTEVCWGHKKEACVQACLGDIAGSGPDHLNKANVVIKQVS